MIHLDVLYSRIVLDCVGVQFSLLDQIYNHQFDNNVIVELLNWVLVGDTYEAHFRYFIHPGIVKNYRYFRQHYRWANIRRYITHYMFHYLSSNRWRLSVWDLVVSAREYLFWIGSGITSLKRLWQVCLRGVEII